MKKFISTAAALGLLAGMATTASAVEFSVKGKYLVEGYHLSDTPAGAGVQLAGSSDSDAYWMHTFQILPTMKVNDKISMSADIRAFKEAVWGTGQDDGTANLDIDKLWMDYASPIGKIRVGRVETSVFGGKFLDSSASGNRLMWWPSFMPKPFELLLFTQKSTEDDYLSSTSDRDNDVYKAQIAHTSDAGKAAIEYIYNRNANAGSVQGATQPSSLDNHHIGVWGKYKLSNFTLEAELAHKFGDASNVNMTVTDWEAWAAMLDVTGKFGPADAGLMYFYASGDSDTGDDKNKSAMSAYSGTGDDFTPLYILTGDHTGILNDDRASFGDGHYALQGGNTLRNAGVHAFVLHAKYAVSDKLTLSGAIAYAMADKEPTGYDDEYGIEYNIGAAYKLLDNLTYEARAGFLDTGDFFKEGANNLDTNDITILSHHLTMTF